MPPPRTPKQRRRQQIKKYGFVQEPTPLPQGSIASSIAKVSSSINELSNVAKNSSIKDFRSILYLKLQDPQFIELIMKNIPKYAGKYLGESEAFIDDPDKRLGDHNKGFELLDPIGSKKNKKNKKNKKKTKKKSKGKKTLISGT